MKETIILGKAVGPQDYERDVCGGPQEKKRKRETSTAMSTRIIHIHKKKKTRSCG
jgi:hypothetical protein